MTPIPPEATPADREHLLGVFVVPADGGDEPLKVAEDGFVVGWSPDGTLIGLSTLDPDQSGCNIAPAACFYELSLITPDGQGQPLGLGDAESPTWSARENRLLLYRLARGNSAVVAKEIHVADAATGQMTMLASMGPMVQVDDRGTRTVAAFGDRPTWSPDEARVLFSFGEPGALQLYVVKADASEPPAKVTNGDIFEADWSPDSQHIVYSWGGQIYIVAAEGTEPPRKLAIGHQPYWSPDGSRIAFIAKTLPTSEIWLVDPSTGEAGKLVDGDLPYFSPKSVWSPDASRILYRLQSSIYVVDPQSGAPPTKLGDGDSATWSPDGQHVALLRIIGPSEGSPGYSQLFVVSADGSGLTLLVDNLTFGCVTYDWSPDSQRIAFSSIYCPLS